MRRTLPVVADVQPSEMVDALLLTSSIFVCLIAYYLLKVLREPLVLASGGAVSKAYATATQAAVMLLAVPIYAYLAKRSDPRRLIIGITLFVVGLLEGFAWLSNARVPWMGFAFFVLVGIVGVLFVSQFWSFANDLVDEARGERIFPLVTLGMTAGSAVGSELAGHLIKSGMSVPTILRIAAGTFVVHALAYALIDRRAQKHETPTSRPSIAPSEDGLTLIAQSPYLRSIALFIVVMSLVNTNGEFMLSKAVSDQVAGTSSEAKHAAIGAFYGHFFGGVNILALLLQIFVSSRLSRYGGVRLTILVVPIVSLFTSLGVASGLGFAVLRVTKTIENACEYSIANTARALMWLPTTRDEKYKAKQPIDTAFVRFGDFISVGVVQVAIVWFGGPSSHVAIVNVALCALGLVLMRKVIANRARLTSHA